jgi:predicted P-loop ATPase
MNNLQYDGPIKIATGSSRKSASWKNEEVLWSTFAERLQTATRTQETLAEYKAMSKPRRDEIKDVGGFVGGSLKGGRRKAETILQRRLLTLDLDYVSVSDAPWETVELILGCAAVLYSTHSSTPRAPRLRLVIPLARPVSPDEYTAIARRIAGDIGIDLFDDTTYEPHRLMYWPSVSRDADYCYRVADGPWLDPDEQLKRYHDWKDPSEWPVSSRKQDIMKRLAKKQGDPTEKKNVVGAFCRVYSIEDAIETFLPEVYIKCGDGRYTFAGGSTSGGLVIYEDGKFAYSHHGTDPISGKLCNAFDLVRLHMFGEKDDDVAPGTPVSRLPSYTAMSDIAINDEAVRHDLAMTKLKELSDQWDDLPEEETDWLAQLTVSPKGNFEATIDNASLVLLHDPELRGRFYYDEFRERPIVAGDLPWEKVEKRSSDCWMDSDDSGLRRHLEKHYGIESPSKIRDAVELAMLSCKRHPVREYLDALTWDGQNRMDTLFIDYLDAVDNEYTREVTRKALIGAVARIYSPGCKHDHALVLVGPQGCRKSTTLAKLGKQWFSDSLYTVSGKDAYEQLQGHWIIEMGEMAATKKAELEQIKQFMSKQTDSYRAAYARRTQEHPRQCAFFGTTNDNEFMRDSTGGRRFWPVVVTEKGKELGGLLTDEIVDQIWAEAVMRYEAGEQWYLSERVEKMARKVQEEHTEMNGKQGLIENFLDTLLPKDWDKMDLDKRMLFWGGGFGEKEEGTEPRNRVCAIEIWQELFRGDPKSFTPMQAREINGILRRIPGWKSQSSMNCGIYGRQRGFSREVEI